MLVTYSMAGGLSWHTDDAHDRGLVEQLFERHGLGNGKQCQEQNDVVRVIRGISSLSRTPMEKLKWADGRDLRLCFLLEFSEHLVPGTLNNGTQTDSQLVAIELAHITAQSQALRASSHYIIFHGREGLLDGLVSGVLTHVRLAQPNVEEKKHFLEVALSNYYKKAAFENGIVPDVVARITNNTPNRGLEGLLRASDRSGRKVTAQELVAQKVRDVREISEGTLTVLDTDRVDGIDLAGINIQKPCDILSRLAAALRRGDRSTPMNVLLCGSPGGGKTDLAMLGAKKAGVPAYQLLNPKAGVVGETERRARLQQEMLAQWTPAIGFVDELTEAFPMERSDFDGDNGASRAVMAAWLTGLSDASLAGKRLIISTTNCPWRMSAAMRSRFVVIPVLHPVVCDYPRIVVALARRVSPSAKLNAADPAIIEASNIFYAKAASPRHIQEALKNAIVNQGEGQLSAKTVLAAAKDHRTGIDHVSTVYADLWAIKATTSRSFLPWTENPASYPYPAHLENIVDPETGEINEQELDKRIEHYRPHANV
jgi:AAA+ superfamily predicted ATPase